MPRKNVAVVLASGTGERAGFSRPKQMMKLAGRPVVAHALERFQSHDGIHEIAIVTNEQCLPEIEDLVSRERISKAKRILLGGKERYESSLAAIRAYEADAAVTDLKLLFHDAVRPLINHGIVTSVLDALQHYDAVDVALSVTDTVIVVDGVTNTIRDIPDRRMVKLGQTPQGFAYPLIRQAYDRALADPGFTTTDDCGVVLRYASDSKVFVVEGEASNMKLTFAEDLMIIDKFMQSNAGRRIVAGNETVQLSRLRDRVIAIVGGTSGIGEAMAHVASAYGARVAVAGKSTGVDIGNGDAVQGWVQDVVAKHGGIDAIVNAAAILDRQPLMSMDLAQIRASIETNFLGAVNVAHAGYDALSASRGHLMMFASSSYTYGRALYSTYSASKAAIVNLTQALADEWANVGISVNCINPERARTPMRTRAFGSEPSGTLLEPDVVARKALGVLVGHQSGIIYDVTRN